MNGRRNVLKQIAAGSLLVLDACSRPLTNPTHGRINVAPGLALVMPSPASLGRRVEASQLVIAHHGTQNIAFEGRISGTPERFDLLCIDPLGRQAMRIHWTSDGIMAEKAREIPAELRPENVLADLVMIYWPAEVVNQALVPSGGSVSVQAGRRTIGLHGAETIDIAYEVPAGGDPWNGKARYRNLPLDYALNIQSRLIGP